MVGNSKIIYLQKEDGKKIKVYVVDYLLHQKSGKTYVIVANQDGKNSKGFEIVENQAVILPASEVAIFKKYKTNPEFSNVTESYADGLCFELVKEVKNHQPEEETVPVVYYVYDNESLNAYKADLSSANVLKNIRFLRSFEQVTMDDVAKILIKYQCSEPSFVVYDKKNDLEFQSDGTVIPVKWTAADDIINAKAEQVVEYEMPIEEETEYEETLEELHEGEEPYEEAVLEEQLPEETLSEEVINEGESYEGEQTIEETQYEGTIEELHEDEEQYEETVLEEQLPEEEPLSEEVITEGESYEEEQAIGETQYEGTIEELHEDEEQYEEAILEEQLPEEPLSEKIITENELYEEEQDKEIEIDGEPIIFYVYDQNIVKKYTGLLTEKQEDTIEVKKITTIEVITGAENLNINQFLARKDVEIGSYFVTYDDYNPTIENRNGTLIAIATLDHPICKTEEMEQYEEAEETTLSVPKKEKQVLVFMGEINDYDGINHYTIWGCFCTVLSEDPLTLIPEKNGVKTIIYENENASSIQDLCQMYQNLYPNYSVYLLNEIEIRNGDELILEPEQYIAFKAELDQEQGSLLKMGRRVLTEEEMIAKRQEELENLKKK